MSVDRNPSLRLSKRQGKLSAEPFYEHYALSQRVTRNFWLGRLQRDMKTFILEVSKSGATIELVLVGGASVGKAVLVLPDEVSLKPAAPSPTEKAGKPTFSLYESRNGFPPRTLTKQTIVQILREHGGKVRIRDNNSGWNIYDEIAARLNVSIEARRRRIPTGESAWRPEVGYCREDLKLEGIIEPTEVTGVGCWGLTSDYEAKLREHLKA